MPIRVVQFGVGPIGQACVKTILEKTELQLVGAIDIDQQKAGHDLAEICGLDESLGLTVRSDAEAALREWRPNVVVHTTTSFLDKTEEQLATIINAGAHVVSSTEELFYPHNNSPEFCQRIDRQATEQGVAVVGTGVNPGFAMDILPLTLTGVCTRVKSIRVTRIGDASKRRLPFQLKIGAGISKKEFRQKLATGTFGHIGLRESAQMIYSTLGWKVNAVEERIKPIIAANKIKTKFLVVKRGQVAGIHQLLRCKTGKKVVLTLDWQMSVGAKKQYDAVQIKGAPNLTMRIDGGIFGDTGTIGSLVNTIPKILNAKPGLRTMRDLPIPYILM